MIQWYDAICSGCGAQWPKDTVTISAFQTYTSMCLKGKKPCTARPQFQRVSNGEKFVVDDHMLGHGGTDLTPNGWTTLLIRVARGWSGNKNREQNITRFCSDALFRCLTLDASGQQPSSLA